MYYIRHYCVSPFNETLQNTLEHQFNIDVKVLINPETKFPDFLVFDVSDMHPQIDQINLILPQATSIDHMEEQTMQHKDSLANITVPFVTITYMPRYTEDELKNAKWLDIRNVSSKVEPVNHKHVDTYQCFIKNSKLGAPLGHHEVQANPYIIKKPIKWGRSSFVSAVYHEERLFCNKNTRYLLEHNGFVGIQFLPVLQKSTSNSFEDIFQISTSHIIPDNAIVSVSGMTKYVCNQCGMHMLRWGDGRSQYGLLKNILDESIDLWKTPPMFYGSGDAAPHSAQERVVISQRLYRFLIDRKLDRGFVFTPLEMLSP